MKAGQRPTSDRREETRRVAASFPSDLLDLKAFCLAVDLGSVTRAARALGETKGTVSRRLTRLERALGTSLLRRSPRLVSATEDGLVYRARVGRALEAIDEANSEVQHARATPSGHLRVTAPTDLGLVVVAALVARFSERYPDVSVELVLTEALLDFDAHQIDVALRAGTALRDSSLIAHKLKEMKGGLFASPAYIEKNGQPRRPEDLHRYRLLLAQASRGEGTLTLQRGSREEPIRLRVRAAIAASDFSFGREVALADGGIALLPCVVADADVTAGRLVPVLREYTGIGGALFLLHRGTRLLPPKVRAFRDHVLEHFRAPDGRAM